MFDFEIKEIKENMIGTICACIAAYFFGCLVVSMDGDNPIYDIVLGGLPTLSIMLLMGTLITFSVIYFRK